jgi:hypothetical protein
MRQAFLCLWFACVVSTVSAQQASYQEEHRFVMVPRDQGMYLIAPQPDSPLKFEDVKLLANMRGLWLPSFRLRNGGSKPIRAFTVAAAGSGEWSWEAPNPEQYVMPGQFAPLFEDSKDQIVLPTEELRNKLKLRGSMKGVLVLVVVRVDYADGTKFREEAYEELRYYFEKISAGCAMERKLGP